MATLKDDQTDNKDVDFEAFQFFNFNDSNLEEESNSNCYTHGDDDGSCDHIRW